MKKLGTTLLMVLVTHFTYAVVINRTIGQVINATTTQYQLDINNDATYDATFNSFTNGAFSVTGRVGGGLEYRLATGVISGSNNYPIKVYNNKTFTNLTGWKSSGIFIHSPALSYTAFAGKGNEYIVGRMNTTGGSDYYYFWILINVNAAGTQLTIVKCAFENEPNVALLTGNEGEKGTSITPLGEPQNNIVIYPQPAGNFLYFDTENTIDKIQIFDLKESLLKENIGFNTNFIDVADLPKGIYLLRLFINNGANLTRRIIIDK